MRYVEFIEKIGGNCFKKRSSFETPFFDLFEKSRSYEKNIDKNTIFYS